MKEKTNQCQSRDVLAFKNVGNVNEITGNEAKKGWSLKCYDNKNIKMWT